MTSTPQDVSFNSKSMYDVIMENLEMHKRVTYIHRIIYAFQYDRLAYDLKDDSNLANEFKKIIEYQNSRYQDERATGLLVLFENMGIHMIEGSDLTISRHVELIYRPGNIDTILPNATFKLVLFAFHIDSRMHQTWSYKYAYPMPLSNTITEVLEEDPLDIGKVHEMFIEILIAPKGAMYRNDKVHLTEVYSDKSSKMGVEEEEEEGEGEESGDNLEGLVPPIETLEILLNNNYLVNLENYSNRFKALPSFVPYHESVWPLPTTHTPIYSELVPNYEEEIKKNTNSEV